MTQSTMLSNSLRNALYFGEDTDLQETVRVSIMSKYSLEFMQDIPHIWPDDIQLVLIEFNGDVQQTLNQVHQILTLAQGVTLYILLKEKDADFIIEASHHGVQGFIECPNEVLNILSILHMQDRRRKGKNGVVSSFFSLKGGVGCTALAANSSAYLNEMTDQKTVLVDLNMPFGDAALYLNMESQNLYSLTDFVYNLNRFDEKLIYKSLSQHKSGTYLLPLPTDVAELENLNGDSIRTIIHVLRRYFDHVIIDCASDLSDITLSCLEESDNITLVAEPSLSSFRSVNTTLQITQQLGFVKESIKLVINRSQPGEDEMMDEIVEAFALDTVLYIENNYAAFHESLKAGVLVKDCSEQGYLQEQLHNLANMLHTNSFQTNEQLQDNQKSALRSQFFGLKKLLSKSSGSLEKKRPASSHAEPRIDLNLPKDKAWAS